jgi:hypothetical protein
MRGEEKEATPEGGEREQEERVREPEEREKQG